MESNTVDSKGAHTVAQAQARPGWYVIEGIHRWWTGTQWAPHLKPVTADGQPLVHPSGIRSVGWASHTMSRRTAVLATVLSLLLWLALPLLMWWVVTVINPAAASIVMEQGPVGLAAAFVLSVVPVLVISVIVNRREPLAPPDLHGALPPYGWYHRGDEPDVRWWDGRRWRGDAHDVASAVPPPALVHTLDLRSDRPKAMLVWALTAAVVAVSIYVVLGVFVDGYGVWPWIMIVPWVWLLAFPVYFIRSLINATRDPARLHHVDAEF